MKNLDYVKVDLNSPFADSYVDVCSLPFPDNTFDVIFCNHVLEHVRNDSTAISELYRVLRPAGWAVMQVPVEKSLTVTVEDPLIVDPLERERHFGQHDHVRLYGSDYAERLTLCGFRVEVIDHAAHLDARTLACYGLDSDEDIYLCVKSGENPSDMTRFAQ